MDITVMSQWQLKISGQITQTESRQNYTDNLARIMVHTKYGVLTIPTAHIDIYHLDQQVMITLDFEK